MAGVEVVSGSPLQKALQDVAHQKVVEIGWTGLDDTSLAEYVVLMLMNGKTQNELASELATELLGLQPDDPAVVEFVSWLFPQVHQLNAQINRSAVSVAGGATTAASNGGSLGDSDMAEMSDGQSGTVPTGPKAMRAGSGNSGNGMNKQRDRRMLGQVQKNMDRQGDAALHRVRGGAHGVGRVGSHSSRDPPKGPRAANIARGMAMQQPHFMPPNGPSGMPLGMNGMNGMDGMGGMGPGMAPNAVGMDQAQMQQFLSLMENAASVMQQYSMQGGGPVVNPNFHRNQGKFQQRGGFNRGDRRQHQNGSFKQRQQTQDTSMGDGPTDESMDTTSPLDSELTSASADPSTSRCHFDLACTRADCPYVHQSPAAPPKTSIDLSDTCSFGAACRNSKCVGKHPSPAKKREFQNEQMCSFYPNCTKGDRCPFKHPTKGSCRNGADCQTAGCEWWHTTVECKFDPCTRPDCPYKHKDGQKRGKFENKIWTAKEIKKDHVSERKFTTDEDGPEELILPGSGNGHENDTNMDAQIITEG